MKYNPPIIDNKPYWVPIVVKNKDYLIGYIRGFNTIEDIILASFKNLGLNINGMEKDLCLDSTRFNNILEDGQRMTALSDNELQKYYENLIYNKLEKINDNHPDNNYNIFKDTFLTVQCQCKLGIYSFKTPNEIPDSCFKCSVCGRILIDYTFHDDLEIDYAEY